MIKNHKPNATEHRMTPSKLKHDAILEAVFEVRFQCDDLPEVVVGRLADREEWKSFSKSDLPVVNIPAHIRRADENLRYEPIILMQSKTGDRLSRIGEQVVSHHVLAPYCGWSKFQEEILELNEWLFTHLSNTKFSRLGLRYIDALRSDVHKISNLSSLNLRVSVGNRDISDEFMLHFFEHPSPNHDLAARISSKGLVLGPMPDSAAVVTDIDVFTPKNYECSSATAVREWLESAHQFSKVAFFDLLPTEVLKELSEG